MTYRWIVVVVAAVLLFISGANNNSFGVFFKPIAEEFGWSRETVSIAIAIRWVVVAVMVMPMGHLSDQYGPRRVILPCFFLIAAGLLLTSKVTAIWHIFLVQGLVMGAGTAGPFVCLVSTVSKWHHKRRGLALGLASVGGGLSLVVFPPLAAGLISSIGWQLASAALGLAVLIIGVPASLFMKDPPWPRNTTSEMVGSDLGRERQSGRQGPFDVMRSIPHLLRNRQFLSLFVVFSLMFIGGQLVNNHLVNYATDAGIGTLVAATMMSAVGIASVVGRLAMGPISDRIGTRADMVVCCSLVTGSLVFLMFNAEPLMWLSVVLFGVGWGGAIPLMPAITGDYFGTKSLATMTGAILVGAQLGSAIGPWMGGFIFDLTKSYSWALILAAVLNSIGLIVALRLGHPTQDAD